MHQPPPPRDQRTAGPFTPPPFWLLKAGKHQPPPTREGGKSVASSKGIEVFLRRFFLKKSGRGVKGARSPLVAVRRRRNTPAPCFWRAGKGVRKSDSFFEGKRTRPLPLVSVMKYAFLENVPVEHFQRKKQMPLLCTLVDKIYFDLYNV